MKRIGQVIAVLCLIVALLGAIGCVVPQADESVHALLCNVTGTAYLNSKVSEGTVAAFIGDKQVAETTTDADGSFYIRMEKEYVGREISPFFVSSPQCTSFNPLSKVGTWRQVHPEIARRIVANKKLIPLL